LEGWVPPALAPFDSDPGECRPISIDALLPADSPRLGGEDPSHVQRLAQSEHELPPILVHGATMRVIDGMHRLRAAVLRGESTIHARIFDGSPEIAFVLSVRENIAHGLPLTLADREAAAERIIRTHPHWSDRAIAGVTGLSAKTVSGRRRRLSTGDTQTVRVGRDGRARPLDGAEGRRRVSAILGQRPELSLRQVAREAGVSPSTARDVRDRLLRHEDPVPPRQRTASPGPEPRGDAVLGPDRATLLHNLRRDPSVRFTEAGRRMVRWFETRAHGVNGWEQVVANAPPHCVFVLADLAGALAEEWREMATRLRQRQSNVDEHATPDTTRSAQH
jgi:ParB-like chromosome segregation protein Spo0J